MPNKAHKMRELFSRPGVIRLMGAHNALGAKIAERAGFDGIWSSGFELSASYCVPDACIITMSEQLGAAESINFAISLPVIADCDTGYGDVDNVIHMVRRFEGVGIAGVCIEDSEFPKLNSFVRGRHKLVSVAAFVEKIKAAKAAQANPDFMVIARVQALIAGGDSEEAFDRAAAYAASGADAILIHSNESVPRKLFETLKKWKSEVPLVVVPTMYFQVTASELAELGVKMIIYANQGLRSAMKAMEETCAEIIRSGSTASVESKIASLTDVFRIQSAYELHCAEPEPLNTGPVSDEAMVKAARGGREN